MFTLPENFISNSLGYVGQFFSDAKPIVFVILGILVAGIIIEIILDAAEGRRTDKVIRDFEAWRQEHRGGGEP